ncbi:hypothetical protein CLOSTMETH_01023 [[Clostridium] methylpentosum DSM 5476]|uniref:Uncharacterized protein n=1 Tax=[Clostridium] methylpentosum DSM 5476 TaxID=537013 RepID=C0EB06_9FIRM|nr:hypothetical protein CLOSTMETH_01023 [[Clostridium] methylpentosum DSM 5476]
MILQTQINYFKNLLSTFYSVNNVFISLLPSVRYPPIHRYRFHALI